MCLPIIHVRAGWILQVRAKYDACHGRFDAETEAEWRQLQAATPLRFLIPLLHSLPPAMPPCHRVARTPSIMAAKQRVVRRAADTQCLRDDGAKPCLPFERGCCCCRGDALRRHGRGRRASRAWRSGGGRPCARRARAAAGVRAAEARAARALCGLRAAQTALQAGRPAPLRSALHRPPSICSAHARFRF
jgi:hypothetical protein